MTWPPHRLDIGAGDAIRALLRCMAPPSLTGGVPGRLVCPSLRSAFHLLLSDLALAAGDEVAFSAITHPDMPRIARLHGLRALPVDLNPSTLAPDAAALARAVGPKTRLIVVAPLFGGLVDLAPIRTLADAAGALLVEDRAQAFAGPGDLAPGLADVSLHSFGMIKTATALGGGMLVARDPALVRRLAARQSTWPWQRRRAVARRAATGAALTVVQNRRVFGAVVAAAHVSGIDLDGLLARSVRGLRPGDDASFAAALELRPARALVATVEARLARFRGERLDRRCAIGDRLDAALPPAATPGRAALRRTHWLYPVRHADPPRLVTALRAQGLDASRGTTSIGIVEAPADRADLDPDAARAILDDVVFVPCYPDLDDEAVARLAATLVVLIEEGSPGVGATVAV
jgi:perosamine synthetase